MSTLGGSRSTLGLASARCRQTLAAPRQSPPPLGQGQQLLGRSVVASPHKQQAVARGRLQHGVSAMPSPVSDLCTKAGGSASQLDADLLACSMAQAKRWCKVEDEKALNTHATQCFSVRGSQGWRLAVSSHKIQSTDGQEHVLLSLALHCPELKEPRAEGEVSDLLLHWGCCSARGGKWKSPNPSWHTFPPISYDAGGGAWQTPFGFEAPEAKDRSTKGPFQVLLLQLPLQGALRNAGAGLTFILKTAAGQWLQDQQTNKDFFFPTSDGATAGDVPTVAARAQAPAAAPSSTATASPQGHSEPKPQQKEREKRYMSQEERNAAELPDITKGVPWNPNEGPRGGQQDNQQIVPVEARSAVQWYSPGVFGPVDEDAVKAYVEAACKATFSSSVGLLLEALPGDGAAAPARKSPGAAVSSWMVEAIAGQEKQAERSLMHRYNTAQQLVEKAGQAQDSHEALTAVLMWLRLSAARHLTWNRNYNVKPREISAAQDHLNTSLAQLFEQQGQLRHVVARSMAAAGRGGSSDVGQRIRDEILAVQSRNACKGGMMEEWHQKLHNNTSPDDVVICQALIAMLEEGLDIRAYWRTLHASGITAQRLASFDRAIRNEPRFSPQQVPGLLVDLRAYLQTLQSVHSGADLGSAAGSVLGFSQKSMKGKLVTVEAVPGAGSPQLRQALLAVLYQQHRLGLQLSSSAGAVAEAELMLQLVLGARYQLRPFVQQGNAATGGRLRDVLFLDMSLDSTARTTLETVMGAVKAEASAWLLAGAAPSAAGPAPAGLVAAVRLVALAVENAALSSDQLQQHEVTEDLCKALKWLHNLEKQAGAADKRDWAMQLVSVVDRLKRSMSENAHEVVTWLQPTALALGVHLGVPKAASCLICEDAARGTSVAPVAQLLAAVEPSARRLAGQGEWQIISPGKGAMQGKLRVEAALSSVQYETCEEPTVLLVDQASGHEEVPEGVIAVLTSGDCPDVLSHSAVRARNMGVLMAACLNTEGWSKLKQLDGSSVSVSLLGSEVKVTVIKG